MTPGPAGRAGSRRRRALAGLLSRVFAALVGLILLSGVAGIAASVWQYQSVRHLGETITPMQLANARLRVILGDAQRAVRGFLLTGDRRFLVAYETTAAEFPATARRLRDHARTAEQRAAIDEQVRHARLWWRHAERQRALEPRSDAAAASVHAGRARFELVVAANARLDEVLAAQEERLLRRAALLRLGAHTVVGAITVLAVLVATLTAVRTTARITRPLDRLVTVLRRLGEGDHAARARTDEEVSEIAAVGQAVNAMAEEVARTRAQDAEHVRLTAAGYELGVQIRQHLSVSGVLDEAVAGLGRALAADHVVIRLAGEDRGPGSARWSATGTPGEDPAAPLAGLAPEWLLGGGQARHCWIWTGADLRGDAAGIPREERSALLAAGATAVLTVAFRGGGPGAERGGDRDRGAGGEPGVGPPAGAATLIRRGAGAGWSPAEVQAAEIVAADLGRALLQADLYEREHELVDRLRDLDKAKTDFMSTASHELRTPLTSIAGYLEMLTDGDAGPLNDAQRRMVAVMERNTARLRTLIEDLLVLSRLESGTLRTHRHEVEYGWLITSAVAAVQPAAAAAGVTVDTDVGGMLAGRADPEQIDRLLTNLLTNAVKFTPRGGHVRVAARGEEDDIVIQVSDTGIGVPEPDRPRLFARFYRASNAADEAVPGTGLGLAIVRTIVEQHGGRVTLESREGEGTTVTVRLPA